MASHWFNLDTRICERCGISAEQFALKVAQIHAAGITVSLEQQCIPSPEKFQFNIPMVRTIKVELPKKKCSGFYCGHYTIDENGHCLFCTEKVDNTW